MLRISEKSKNKEQRLDIDALDYDHSMFDIAECKKCHKMTGDSTPFCDVSVKDKIHGFDQ